MNIFLTFDYELFLGNSSGTPERCLIEPTEALLEIASRHGATLVFFVDIGYLARLASDRARTPSLERDYGAVRRQIDSIISRGHEVQLHIHPGWKNAIHDNGNWKHDLAGYRLHDFSISEAAAIITEYSRTLNEVSGVAANAFRAGGWCIQPFAHIADALWNAGIRVDSTVIPGARSSTGTHAYNFTMAPAATRWFFSDDPAREDSMGKFLEIPIGSQVLPPWFFFRFSVTKLLANRNRGAFAQFGDGMPVGSSKKEIIEKLLKSSVAPVSCDGYRCQSLERAYLDAAKTDPDGDFVVIGHPKAQSPYSLAALDRSLARMREDPAIHFRGFQGA